jgi:hypothetical protein
MHWLSRRVRVSHRRFGGTKTPFHKAIFVFLYATTINAIGALYFPFIAYIQQNTQFSSMR